MVEEKIKAFKNSRKLATSGSSAALEMGKEATDGISTKAPRSQESPSNFDIPRARSGLVNYKYFKENTLYSVGY